MECREIKGDECEIRSQDLPHKNMGLRITLILSLCITSPLVINTSNRGSVAVRDWSLITGRGCYKTGGGHVKFYPPTKRGGRKSFSHAEGGAQKVLG